MKRVMSGSPKYDFEKREWVCRCGKALHDVTDNGKIWNSAYCRDCLIKSLKNNLSIGSAFNKGDKFVCVDVLYDSVTEVELKENA